MGRPEPLQTAQCYFCAARTRGQYVTTTDVPPTLHARQGGDTRTRLVVPLCALHHALLKRAGSQGRVHRSTRVRWWLGVH
jgi:hypothetical protein